MAETTKSNSTFLPKNPDAIRAVYANCAGVLSAGAETTLIFAVTSYEIGENGQEGAETRVVSMVCLPTSQAKDMIRFLEKATATPLQQTDSKKL